MTRLQIAPYIPHPQDVEELVDWYRRFKEVSFDDLGLSPAAVEVIQAESLEEHVLPIDLALWWTPQELRAAAGLEEADLDTLRRTCVEAGFDYDNPPRSLRIMRLLCRRGALDSMYDYDPDWEELGVSMTLPDTPPADEFFELATVVPMALTALFIDRMPTFADWLEQHGGGLRAL